MLSVVKKLFNVARAWRNNFNAFVCRNLCFSFGEDSIAIIVNASLFREITSGCRNVFLNKRNIRFFTATKTNLTTSLKIRVKEFFAKTIGK